VGEDVFGTAEAVPFHLRPRHASWRQGRTRGGCLDAVVQYRSSRGPFGFARGRLFDFVQDDKRGDRGIPPFRKVRERMGHPLRGNADSSPLKRIRNDKWERMFSARLKPCPSTVVPGTPRGDRAALAENALTLLGSIGPVGVLRLRSRPRRGRELRSG